jgi:hypothetical protein
MLKSTATLLAIFLITAVPVMATDSLHTASSSLQAEKHNQKHPTMVTQTITANQVIAAPRVCFAYSNTSKRSQGWAIVAVTILRLDGTQEELRLADQVKNNAIIKCTKADLLADLVAGDMVIFEFDFENMLRLRRKGDTVDRINAYSVVVANGFPLYLEEVSAVPGKEEAGKKGGWFHTTNLNFQAPTNNYKHPAEFRKMIVMQQDTAAPHICFLYRNTLNKGGKGKVAAGVSVYRADEMIDSFNIKGNVKKNTADQCQVGQELLAGDTVYFDFSFGGFPRFKKGKKRTDNAETTGVISANGIPKLPTEASPPTPPNPTPGPNPPPPSGGLSSADIAAAAKLLIANRPVQLWRFKGDNPTKWTVIGPRTKLGSGRGGVDEKTAGYGNTIAAAVQDYERKMGKLASGGSLTNADITALVWYSKINSSAGPTSLRRNSAGVFFGEYYRPGRGATHEGPFSSPAKALNWLQGQGL